MAFNVPQKILIAGKLFLQKKAFFLMTLTERYSLYKSFTNFLYVELTTINKYIRFFNKLFRQIIF